MAFFKFFLRINFNGLPFVNFLTFGAFPCSINLEAYSSSFEALPNFCRSVTLLIEKLIVKIASLKV